MFCVKLLQINYSNQNGRCGANNILGFMQRSYSHTRVRAKKKFLQEQVHIFSLLYCCVYIYISSFLYCYCLYMVLCFPRWVLDHLLYSMWEVPLGGGNLISSRHQGFSFVLALHLYHPFYFQLIPSPLYLCHPFYFQVIPSLYIYVIHFIFK